MAEFSLSVSDLILVDGFKEAFAAGDMEGVHAILFNNGMDTAKTVELVRVTHRNLRNQVIHNGERFEGFERLDRKWVKSEYASLEAKIEASEDPNLRYTLRRMCVDVPSETVFNN